MACLMSLTAFAQWQWIDKDGNKVFSDRGPGADIPEKNILKRPGGRVAVNVAASTAGTDETAANAAQAGASAAKAAASAPKPSGVDKDLLEKKKKADEAEAAKRKAEEEKIAKAKAENCTRAKQAKAGFDSGVRIVKTNEKGEREVMDEAARAAEVKRIQSIMDSDCK